MKTAIEELESELALSKRLLSNTDQPYGYLVSQIEAKEREITENKRQLARLNQKYTDLGVQYDILVKV
jgi:chromosome segregation ATPase